MNPNHFANKSVRQFFEEHPERLEFLCERFGISNDCPTFVLHFQKIHTTANALKIDLLKIITFIIYRQDRNTTKQKIFLVLVKMFFGKFREGFTIRTELVNSRLCDLRRLIKFIFYGESSALINLVESGPASNFLDVEPYTCGVCYLDDNTEAFRCPACRKAELCASCFSQIPDLCPFCRAEIPDADEVQDLTFFYNNQPHTYRFGKFEGGSDDFGGLEVVAFDRFNLNFITSGVLVASSYQLGRLKLMEAIQGGDIDLNSFYDFLTPHARIYFPHPLIFEYWTQNDFTNGITLAIFQACGFDNHPEEFENYLRTQIFNLDHSAAENFSEFAGGYIYNTDAAEWVEGVNVIFLRNLFADFENLEPINLDLSHAIDYPDFFHMRIRRV